MIMFIITVTLACILFAVYCSVVSVFTDDHPVLWTLKKIILFGLLLKHLMTHRKW